MNILLLTIDIYIPWSNSLKDKRSVSKSLISKLKNNFNISIVESSDQDILQKLVISIANIVFNNSQAYQFEDTIISFIESNTEAVITNITTEIL